MQPWPSSTSQASDHSESSPPGSKRRRVACGSGFSQTCPPTSSSLRRAFERACSRDVNLAIYTHDLFETNHDEANRAAVAKVAADELDLLGIAFRAERKTVDKIVDRLRFHP
jgi:hypothetical protein